MDKQKETRKLAIVLEMLYLDWHGGYMGVFS